jgi:hypothetical protein
MKINILYHDQCFDGAASAAYLARFFSDEKFPGAELTFIPLAHRPTTGWDVTLFSGDENAIVDFRYASHPQVTWWYDHHESAFLTPHDHHSYMERISPQIVWNQNMFSCAKLVATVLEEEFAFRAKDLDDLIRWADIIDGGLFDSPQAAGDFERPAIRLRLVLDHADPQFGRALILRLMSEPMDVIARDPEIVQRSNVLIEEQKMCIELMARHLEVHGHVVLFDLSVLGVHRFPKFAPYALCADAVYSVTILRTDIGIKISAGTNPWATAEPHANLAALCERFSGGGHRRVAAITLPVDHMERARKIAAALILELNHFESRPA